MHRTATYRTCMDLRRAFATHIEMPTWINDHTLRFIKADRAFYRHCILINGNRMWGCRRYAFDCCLASRRVIIFCTARNEFDIAASCSKLRTFHTQIARKHAIRFVVISWRCYAHAQTPSNSHAYKGNPVFVHYLVLYCVFPISNCCASEHNKKKRRCG